jgi:hypothetical protein
VRHSREPTIPKSGTCVVTQCPEAQSESCEQDWPSAFSVGAVGEFSQAEAATKRRTAMRVRMIASIPVYLDSRPPRSSASQVTMTFPRREPGRLVADRQPCSLRLNWSCSRSEYPAGHCAPLAGLTPQNRSQARLRAKPYRDPSPGEMDNSYRTPADGVMRRRGRLPA